MPPDYVLPSPDVVLAFPRTIIIDAEGKSLRALDDSDLHLPMTQPHRRVARVGHPELYGPQAAGAQPVPVSAHPLGRGLWHGALPIP